MDDRLVILNVTGVAGIRRIDMALKAAGIPVVFDPGQETAAEMIAEAVSTTAKVLAARWRLVVPPTAVIHVLVDGPRFVQMTAPRHYRWIVRWTRRLWIRRVERMLPLVGGWTIPWRGCPAVGVKPPELLRRSPPSIGDDLFEPVHDVAEKVRQVTAHELTHACTAHLALPVWQNEGVAMRAVDHVEGRSTVRDSSRQWVVSDPGILESREFRRAARKDPRKLRSLYATGYWAVREWDESGQSVLEKR